MLNKKEFNDIIVLFKSIHPSPYELVDNIIKVINDYHFFNKSELCIYSDIDINDYPIISKIKIDIHTIQAIELITSTSYKDYHHLIIRFRFYLEEYLYVHLDELCPICCYQFGLILLKYDNIFGIGCPECGFFKDADGNTIKINDGYFYPLNNIELRSYLSGTSQTPSRTRLSTATSTTAR